jgi:CcmD family protein
MDNLRYLFAAYMAVWILLAVYLYSLHSRERKLREEMRRLRRMLEKSGSG